jgi:hypothetical protein
LLVTALVLEAFSGDVEMLGTLFQDTLVIRAGMCEILLSFVMACRVPVGSASR